MVATISSVLPSHGLQEFSMATESGATVAGYYRGIDSRSVSSKTHILVLLYGYPET